VVVDLRGNRGGVLQQAVAAAAMLQANGVVAITSGRDPDAAHVFTADGRDLARYLPVVVLVDGGSASAAEILAASLADQRRAVVVGSSTLGKGLVQTILPLPDGGELLVTWSRVLAPLGWPIQALGVLPQVCTSLGQEALDRQLAALAQGRQPMAAALARERAARAPVPPAEALELRAACPAAVGPAAAGQDADLAAARFLISSPDAYATALLPHAAGGPKP
jgi:carboxyl-terminal processing protease